MLKPRFGFGENGEIVDNGKPDYSNVEDIKPVVRDKEWSRFKKNMEKIKNKHNLLNKIKIMLNKKIQESIVIHGENRTIIHNNIKDLQKTKY